jgi:2-polyprenyl-3-methyl-5-hydroxy-6-metoxy-1,4-benzoquinol methylase
MTDRNSEIIAESKQYWNDFAEEYSQDTAISLKDFHYGPLLPGDSVLGLLPAITTATKCLELGCGGAQNSIYLSSLGAECTALDVAEEQIEHAHKLCAENNAAVKLLIIPMETLDANSLGEFDFIHSSYGLCFSPDPKSVIFQAAQMLKSDGTLLFSLPHPLSAGEALELDDDYGVFINNGYNPAPDCRVDENGTEQVRSFFYSFSAMADWLKSAGLVILDIREPALAIPPESAPFQCLHWEEYRKLFTNIPGTVIVKAGKL